MEHTYRRVVVTGLGAVTPVGKSVRDTWENLKAGKNGIAPITLFDTSRYKAKLAGEVRDFDPLDYMLKSESVRSDRNTQFAVAAAREAVMDSGIKGNIDPDRFAVYLGAGIGGIRTLEAEHTKLLERGPHRVSSLFVPMMIANMAAGTLAIQYGARGPALPAVTACASGSNAVGEAMRLIRHGYADAVISGGTEAAVTPLAVAGFTNMQALSVAEDPDEGALPFDRRRNGFVIGEGAAVLILEELEHAVKRGAKIYGEVCGYGSTCDAYHMTALNPDGESGARAMRMALEEAGYTERDLVYINAHGTGTPMNDVTETVIIKRALGEKAAAKALISSTKSMTGHMLGAAGALEAMVCLLALRDRILPPTINLKERDEVCDLNYIPQTAVCTGASLAVSNSFGFGGHNACLAFRRADDENT
ncbi:MAG: beta-ketoacyl-ACP synthase II [Eubacteriales bacterium]|nr:beta-ketoacyl-[acyl-carrier-protein] synthase II [Sarcina sp.]MDO4416858.1 beta-ketoacyl-ACP synthase II [Eubacteriales bacterium]